MREPKTREAHKLVFELESAAVLPPPPAKPLVPVRPPAPPPEPPKPKKFVDTPVAQKDAPAPKQTDLIGEKNSIAKDNAPPDKKPDGMPKLEGKSESFGTKNVPPSKGPSSPGAPGAMAALGPPPIVKPDTTPPRPEKTPPKEPTSKPAAKPPTPAPSPKTAPAPAVEAKAPPEPASVPKENKPAAKPAAPPPSPKTPPAPTVEAKAPPQPTPAPKESQLPPMAPPAPTPAAQTLAKGPKIKDKDVGPQGVLRRTAPGNVAKKPKPGPTTKIEVETKPPDKPLQVASLPAPQPPPASATVTPPRAAATSLEAPAPAPTPRREEKAAPPEKQVVNSRMVAVMPQPFSPPPMLPQGRKASPNSSAGEKGEAGFNIKQHEYAKYYKHITQKVGSTLDILYGGDMSLISPKPAEQKVIVDFKILRTGEISDVKLVYDGGDYVLSSIILSSVRGTPLDAFPKYIKEDHLKIRYTFYFR